MLRRPYDIFVLVALLLSGCATERKVLRAGVELTPELLKRGGLAVVGVTMVDEVEQIRPPLVAEFEHALERGRPDLVVVSAGGVRDRLGLAAYRRILSAYQRTGSLLRADGAELDSVLEGTARFAVLARVEKDVLHTRMQGRVNLSNRTGSYGEVGVAVTTRHAKVRITMYDLSTRREVLAVVYTSSSENAPPDSVWRLPRRPVVPEPESAPNPRFAPPTETPGLAETLIEGFATFVEELPR